MAKNKVVKTDPFEPPPIKTMTDLIRAVRALFPTNKHIAVEAKFAYYDHMDRGQREVFSWRVYLEDGFNIEASTPQGAWELARAEMLKMKDVRHPADEQAALVTAADVAAF